MSKTRFEYKKPLDSQDSSVFFGGHLTAEVRKEEIFPYFSIPSLGVFAQTAQKVESETAFLRLLAASINAAPEFMDDLNDLNDLNEKTDATALASIAILKKHPELLFRKREVTDHYGREIWASPYQLFLGAGDIWAVRQIQKDILPLIENGEGQAEIQFKEQFPNCPWPLSENFCEEMLYDDRNKQQIQAIVEQLDIVKQFIEADPFIDGAPLGTTRQAVETLCKLFQPEPEKVIRSGLHFPPAIIKEIYKTYNGLRGHWSFFSLAIIKPALDALSTVDGQCCQGGLSNLDMEKGPSRRCHSSYQHPLGKPLTLTFVNDKDKRDAAAVVDSYDGDVLFASTSYPGSFACYNKNGGRGGMRVGGAIGRMLRGACARFWKTYGEQKQQVMGAICGHAKRSQHNVSMIMTNQ